MLPAALLTCLLAVTPVHPRLGAAPPQEASAASRPESSPESSLVAPLVLDRERPELRAARAILVLHTGVPGVPHTIVRSKEEAAALAARLRERLLAGEPFAPLALEFSGHPSAVYGGVLGSYFPGILRPEVDAFLFSAGPGELSGPLDTPIGYQLLQRIDARAGCLHIILRGDDREQRAAEVIRRLDAGEDFGDLAAEFSDDAFGREQRGQHAIFTRGPSDSLLKAAIFEARPGERIGPVELAEGTLSIAVRVPPEELDPVLDDDQLTRVRAILIQAVEGRDMDRSEALAELLAERIRAGEDMAALAAEYDDDPGGRERGGDLGWVLRRASRMRPGVERVFTHPLGELVGPIKMSGAFLLLRRER